MSGRAYAVFQCGAMIYGGEGIRPDYPCEKTITVDLVDIRNGWNAAVPVDWHIQLETPGTEQSTIVRCPEHCVWVERKLTVDFDGWGNPCAPRETTVGHWEDYGMKIPPSKTAIADFIDHDKALISAALNGDRGVLIRAAEMINDAQKAQGLDEQP